jgi:ABC-type phosphate/phosphonate transport system substrate-binding protein
MKAKVLLSAVSLALAMGVCVLTTGCTISKGELGTEKNPIKLFFVPSVDAKVIEENSVKFKDFLEKKRLSKTQKSPQPCNNKREKCTTVLES